jgi:protein phosphatase 1 regulatory subunit 7
MRLERITDPGSIDEGLIARSIANGAHRVVLQFSKESAYSPSILEDVNRACRTFGVKVNVRFWAHYGSQFDCIHLRRVPEVRSLNLDCLAGISNVAQIGHLDHLEEFSFGVFESDLPDLLNTPSLFGLRKLILAGSRRNNIDLAPLVGYERLETLFLSAQKRHIESVGRLHSIKKLSLSCIEKSQSLGFVGRLHGLSALTLLLGGRNNLEQLAHDGIKHLEVLRVRGMNTIDLALFPKIEDFRVEDQVQLQNLNLDGGPNLRSVSIWNCKTFSDLQGMRHAHRLESLFVEKTAIDPDAFLCELPANLKQVSLSGYGKRKDDGLRNRIDSLGYAPAKYMEDIHTD